MQSRIIFHVDVNSAFLSWKAAYQVNVQKSMIDLRDIPSAIGGSEESRHGVVLAKSIPAKQYGVRTGEPLVHARQKCPELVVVPPDFPLYVEYSKAFIEVLKKYAPVVEQCSIDEAFCDMTGTGRLYGDMQKLAHRIKDEIYDTLGFTVNIGISSNKLLAKMASDFEKPNKVHTLFPEEIASKMWPMPVGELYFVGNAAEKKLRHLGIRTIGDLAHMDRHVIASHLKKHGEIIWNYANGIDDTPVSDADTDSKCIGNSTTISHDVTDADEACQILLSLTETVCARLRAENKKATCISVQMTDCNFVNSSHQDTLFSASDVTSEIYERVQVLFRELWDGTPIRLLGVQASRLSEDALIQTDLFEDSAKREKLSKLDAAVDSIRGKFGEDAVKRACFIGGNKSHMTGGLNKARRENHR